MNPFLAGLTPLYAAAIALRNAAYDAGLFKTHRIGVPVISIGNITAGGSGKTPLVAYTASLLHKEGYRPAIVSRGYKRASKGTVIVSEGKTPLVDAVQGGDEPVMLARHCPGTVVIVDEDRVRGCHAAIARYGVNVIVLDDAYQHRRCARDLNVLVYDTTVHPDNQRLLPAGRLREPLHQTSRADFLLFTRCASAPVIPEMQQALRKYTTVPAAGTRFLPDALRNCTAETLHTLSQAPEIRPFAFCGIGSPASFRETLREAGIFPAGFLSFPDHHAYTHADITTIVQAAQSSGADSVITTEKDAVRIDTVSFPDALPVYSLRMGIAFLQGEDAFREAIMALLRTHKTTPSA